MDLPDEEVATLYSAPEVCDYLAEEVDVILLSDRVPSAALCYNLPPGKLGAKPNSEYVEKLSALVLQLGFPPDYANEIMRRPGALKGQIRIAPDFDELPDDIAEAFGMREP